MINSAGESESNYAACLESPGQYLHETRKKNRLSVGQIAARLRLTEKLVVALETDNFDAFPAPIFVSGYLRNYAKILAVSPEPLLSAFHQHEVIEPTITSITSAEVLKKPVTGISYWAIGLVAIGLLVVGVYFAWWPQDVTENNSAELRIDGVHEMQEIQEMQPGKKLGQDGALPAKQTTHDVNIEIDASMNLPRQGPPAATIQKMKDKIVLNFNDDSWAELIDATGKRIFYDLGKAGQARVIQGTAPFKILLGYSPGVVIEYNGVHFDQTPYARDDIARFTLR